MILLEHYTSIENMEAILTSKKFKTAYLNNPEAADAVFNCFIVDHEYNKRQNYGGVGVTIMFEWYGKNSNFGPWDDWKIVQPSILYDSPCWRAFIKPPLCKRNLLKVNDVIIDDSCLKKYIKKNTTKLIRLLPKGKREKILKYKESIFRKKITKLYKNENLYIEITNNE